jgi:hypothetical protein
MTYISSEDARRENSEELVEGFPTPRDELFKCTCHGRRWPLNMLRMENNGQRHCPNQARPQGGSIDRTMIENRDRVELQRRAVDDARPVKWPFSRLEDAPIVHSIAPRPAIVPVAGTAVVVVKGLYLSAADTITFSSASVTLASAVFAGDGTSCTLTVNGVLPRTDVDLFYNGSEYDKVFLVR